jgi:hypothetical protein
MRNQEILLLYGFILLNNQLLNKREVQGYYASTYTGIGARLISPTIFILK